MRVHGYRGLINRKGHHSTAAVVAEVEDTKDWKPGKNGQGNEVTKDNWFSAIPYTSLTMSDCSRSISLDINWETYEDRKNAIHKVETLIVALRRFHRGLEIEQKRYVERMKKAPRGG